MPFNKGEQEKRIHNKRLLLEENSSTNPRPHIMQHNHLREREEMLRKPEDPRIGEVSVKTIKERQELCRKMAGELQLLSLKKKVLGRM